MSHGFGNWRAPDDGLGAAMAESAARDGTRRNTQRIDDLEKRIVELERRLAYYRFGKYR